jgi:hypothetical protein
MLETKTIGTMTDRQRRALAQLLATGDAAASAVPEPAEALHAVQAAV